MREFPKRRMSADTPCVNNSYRARPWFTDVNKSPSVSRLILFINNRDNSSQLIVIDSSR